MTDLKSTGSGFLTNYSLDRFVSHNLSKLTECNAPEIACRFPQSSHWIANFILNSMFGSPVSDDARKLCLALLRRAEAAFFNYELARESLVEVAESVKGEGTKVSLYFRALQVFEVCLAMQWQAISLFGRLTPNRPFKSGDGTSYEKLNRVYNVSKHADPNTLPADLLHAVWISNEGINIPGLCLTFAELERLLVELGGVADHASSIRYANAKDQSEAANLT